MEHAPSSSNIGAVHRQEEEEKEDSRLPLLLLFQQGDAKSSMSSSSSSSSSSIARKTSKIILMTDWEAGVSLAKAIMGAGSFALPWAFSQMGYLLGPICLAAFMMGSVYSLSLLIQCASATTTSTSSSPFLSYVDVARATFGPKGATAAYMASVSASMGVCGSYLVFVAANLQSLLKSSSSSSFEYFSQNALVGCVLPVAILLSSVRDVKRFAMASFLGDVSVVLGMLVVLIYGFWYHSSSASLSSSSSSNRIGHGCVAVANWQTMPLALGAIGYLFLVHFLSLPIASSMAHPQHFHAVAKVTFAICAIFSGSFGILGYLLFGNDTKQIVLLNVVTTEGGSYFFVSAVQLLLCIDLLLTYPVVMRPTIVIIEQSLLHKKRQEKAHHHHHYHCDKNQRGQDESSSSLSPVTTDIVSDVVGTNTHFMVCTLLGLVAASASIFIPAFGLLSGLVGGVSQTFLAFVMPPLMLAKQKQQLLQLQPKQQKQEQQQRSIGNILCGMGRRETCLVMIGLTLILWTLVSAWSELRGEEREKG